MRTMLGHYRSDLERFLRPTVEKVAGGWVITCLDCGTSPVIRREMEAVRARWAHEMKHEQHGSELQHPWPRWLTP